MLRILNKIIPSTDKILFALQKIYGINFFQSKKICKYVGINPKIKTIKIKTYHTNRLKNYIKDNLLIEHFLKEKQRKEINILLEDKNIKGIRHYFGLPVRGQRTHSNAKTSRKNKIKNTKKFI
jgi:small subunit ribosomal protein S13